MANKEDTADMESLPCLRSRSEEFKAVHLRYKREKSTMQEVVFSLHIRLEVRTATSIAEESSLFKKLSIGGILKIQKGLDH